MHDPEEPTILAGLLDFYSDRATAHASFVVAAVFGIYTIFAIWYSNKDVLLLSFPFLFLLLFEVYSFSNFSFYAVRARIVRNMLMGTRQKEYDDLIRKRYRERRYTAFAWFEGLKNTILEKDWQLIVYWFGSFVVAAQVLPWMTIWCASLRETAFHFFVDVEWVHILMVICLFFPLIITAYRFTLRYWESRSEKRRKTKEASTRK